MEWSFPPCTELADGLYPSKRTKNIKATTEGDIMDAIVVDIDDTLVYTDIRRHTAWCQVLGREIPLIEVESKGSWEILSQYAFSSREVWKRFWLLLQCVEERGADLLQLDKPIPYASETLRRWDEEFKLVYFTGRTSNMRKLTLDQLKRFDFPTEGTDLEMFSVKHWENFLTSQSSIVETRSKIFSSILERYNVLRVVDDYPGFFTAYKEHPVPDKIGLLRKKRFSPQDYFANGATRVVESWKELYE